MDYLHIKESNKQLNSDEARRGLTRLKSRPLYFWFDLYGPCNLKCVHCGFQKVGRTSEQEVSEHVYQEVLRELMPTAFTCNLGGTNWGEMTISKNFHRFLLDCKKYGVRVNLTTNGTRMNDEWFVDLLDTLDVIGFSMEGMEEAFETIRGFPWKRFIANIEKLVQGKRDRGKSFRVEWRYCAHVDSIHQLPDMIRVAKRIGIDRIQVMPLVPYVKEQKYKNLSYHRATANQWFDRSREVARELDFAINIPDNYATGEFDSRLLRLKTKAEAESIRTPDPAIEMVNCFRPWQTCSINELGSVRPCCIYWRPVGDLSNSSFAAVWNGRKYRDLRRSINVKPDSICYDCRLSSFDAEQGRVAAELHASPKQIIVQMGRSLFERREVRFANVLDSDLDPTASTVHTPVT